MVESCDFLWYAGKTLDQFSISFDLFGCLFCLQACILAVGKAEQQVLVDEDSEKG